MITIKAQSSPRNASRYFSEHLSRDDYYSEQEKTVGRWYGKTCDALGIKPESTVEKDQFAAQCKRLRPDDLIKSASQITSTACEWLHTKLDSSHSIPFFGFGWSGAGFLGLDIPIS